MLYNFRKLFTIAILLIAFLITFNRNCLSQNQYTRNFTIDDGLPSNTIHDIFKDSRGYYWIGTEAGLCKFDGVTFTVYTQRDGLAGNRIWSITEDKEGNLWIACYGNGISRFDGSTFKNYSANDGLVNDNVIKIKYSGKSNGLLIGTVFGFSFFKNSEFTSFKDTTITKREFLQVTDFIDCDSTVYLLTFLDNFHFIKFNPCTKDFQYLPSDHRFHKISGFSSCSFITSKKDTIISNFFSGMKIYNGDSIKFINGMPLVCDITEEKNGDLWIASWNDGEYPCMTWNGGIYRLRNDKVESFNKKLGIKTQLCRCIYYDKDEELLFIGTEDEGLYIYKSSGIEYYPVSDFNTKNPVIKDIIIDTKGRKWLSVGDRIIMGEINSGFTVKSVRYDELTKKGLKEFSGFFEDDSANIWVKSNIGLTKFGIDGKNSSFDSWTSDETPFFIESDTIAGLLHYYELIKYSIKKDSVIEKISLRKNVTISSMCNYYHDGNAYWIYNNTDGIFKYESGKLKRFRFPENIKDLSFTALTGDKKKNLIAGTNSGKIYILRNDGESFEVVNQISQEEGIIGSDIRWVLIDNSDRLWFATNKGLNMLEQGDLYNKANNKIRFFNEENGFFDKQSFKAQLDSNGFINIISANNFFKINPDELVRSTNKIFKIIIKKINVNFSDSKWTDDFHTDPWTGVPESGAELPYDKNTLIFYFHMLQLSEPLKVQYSYKLEGLQNEWTQFSPDAKAVFTTLRKGKYTLRIRGRLLSSPDRISEAEYSFRILPPWWSTWWFLIIIIISGVVILWYVSNLYIKAVKKKADINRRIAELKMESLKSQMNPHFIFNAFNSIQKYILQKDTKAALDYMSDFASLIRQTLDNSSKESITLDDGYKYLTSYIELEKKRYPDFDYKFDIDQDLDLRKTTIPPMLIQPFVENAILHGIRPLGKRGMLLLKFKLSGDRSTLICTVEDNGIGRAKSAEINKIKTLLHTPQGTKNILQRVQLLGYSFIYFDLHDASGNPSGTRVVLNIRL
ncbi:MAG TPA: histidine kinase [Bacteroidales bacterium]|nr:histidine kinase [Bacteroidales bacterium]